MIKSFKYRLYPTAEQTMCFDRHIDAARLVYNLALEVKVHIYNVYKSKIDSYSLIKQLPELKQACPWLKEVNSQSLQMAIRNLDNAFTNLFKGRGGFPRFKKKYNGGSFHVPQHFNFDLVANTLSIPKLKQPIKVVLHRRLGGEAKSITISKTSTGKYYVSVLVDTGQALATKPSITKPLGIDLGIKDFAVLSTGEKISNPKYLNNNLDRLKFLQRRASRKNKGTANSKKAYHRVVTLYERITNQRKDFLHKLSSMLVNNHDSIAIEDLAVKNMVKNHSLAQAISDVSWSEFRRQLTYKCEWMGKNLLVIDRFAPSSKMCSDCGTTNHSLTLSDREWVCGSCGTLHDRDHNAAVNISNFALIKYKGAIAPSGREPSVEPVESPTLVGAMKQEYEVHLV